MRNYVVLGWTLKSVPGLAKKAWVELLDWTTYSHSETTGIVKLLMLSPFLVNGSTYSRINSLVLLLLVLESPTHTHTHTVILFMQKYQALAFSLFRICWKVKRHQ